jgi:hypothetical protein
MRSLSAYKAIKPTRDANLDSGFSMSMTPDTSTMYNLRPNSTPVCLVDHLVVDATHKGTISLPLDGKTTIKSLVVPSLHEPLISIANLCDTNLTVVVSLSLYGDSRTLVLGDTC